MSRSSVIQVAPPSLLFGRKWVPDCAILRSLWVYGLMLKLCNTWVILGLSTPLMASLYKWSVMIAWRRLILADFLDCIRLFFWQNSRSWFLVILGLTYLEKTSSKYIILACISRSTDCPIAFGGLSWLYLFWQSGGTFWVEWQTSSVRGTYDGEGRLSSDEELNLPASIQWNKWLRFYQIIGSIIPK